MAVESFSSVCKPVNASKVSVFFSRYPAAISVSSREVENALRRIGEQATEEGSRERRRARIRHINPYGDPFAVCHYVTEEMEHSAACREHDNLAKAICLDIDPSTFKPDNVRQGVLAGLLRRAIDMDPVQAPLMIEMLKNYLKTFDNCNDDFETMEEYMPYRIPNCGYCKADYESIKEYDVAMGNVLGLTNDYFSWNVEKDQPTDRIRNGVRVLMREHGVPATTAKAMLLGIIVEEECRAARLKEQRLEKPVSKEILQYLDAIELYVGGSCYWHATAPRYQIFE
ncbi:hypothetical protein FQN49_002557 [Arthroderma sp. PD_2]|nr:hypothetical protein FQN49_002557 [Arthroderma sp. PD_2]